jgi:hypothetical protein
MASAEQLINEAQYAFQSISSGESRDNRRNASRARSLCRKIIRKFPTSSEAVSAYSILQRLGDEAYVTGLPAHDQDSTKHTPLKISSAATQQRSMLADEPMVLDWSGLLQLIFNSSKSNLAIVGTIAFVLFAIMGPFFLVPLIALMAFTGPFKQLLQPKQRQKVNQFITQTNAYIEERRKIGGR